MDDLTFQFALLIAGIDATSIIKYGGLGLILALTFLETGSLIGLLIPAGETLLITAGLLSGTDVLQVDLTWMVLGLVAACIAGDITGYYLGTRMGKKLWRKKDNFFFKKKYLYKAKDMYHRHGLLTIIIGRYIPVVRVLNPFVAATTEVKFKRFLPLAVAAAVIWVSSLTISSYYLGREFPQLKDYMGYIVPGIIIVALTPFVITLIKEN